MVVEVDTDTNEKVSQSIMKIAEVKCHHFFSFTPRMSCYVMSCVMSQMLYAGVVCVSDLVKY